LQRNAATFFINRSELEDVASTVLKDEGTQRKTSLRNEDMTYLKRQGAKELSRRNTGEQRA
jgi:hypothetical protein